MANFITLNQLKQAVQSLLIKINDRFDSIVIPSKVSDLDNDSGFITNSSIPTNVSDLTNDAEYQNALQVSSAISSAVANINSFNVSIVQTLPTTNIDTHTIYFISNSGSGTDVYNEYMYINNTWQKIGNTAVDLSGYVPTSRTINNKALTSNISLTASDVGALPSNTTYVSSFNGNSGDVTYTAPVTSVNGQTGAVSLTIPTVTSTYSSTGTDAVNGTAVASALNNYELRVNQLIAAALAEYGDGDTDYYGAGYANQQSF